MKILTEEEYYACFTANLCEIGELFFSQARLYAEVLAIDKENETYAVIGVFDLGVGGNYVCNTSELHAGSTSYERLKQFKTAYKCETMDEVSAIIVEITSDSLKKSEISV